MMDLMLKVLLLFVYNVWTGLTENVDKQGAGQGCSGDYVLIGNENGNIKSTIIQSKYDENIRICQIFIEAKNRHRLLAIVNYFSSVPSDCHTRYLHIGNDKHRPNVESLTSYKYCDQTVSEEIVSRDNFLWIVYAEANNFTDFRVAVSAHEEASCSEREFKCSPIQCEDENSVCDGVTQCDNKRDEYCAWDTDNTVSDGPCFRCADGTCIQPILPRYHDDWRKPLWYLCDNVMHCKDGTDERPDICKSMKGRREMLITCHPTGHPGHTEILWETDSVCDRKHQCENQHGEQLCSNEDEESSGYSTLFVPILIVAIAVIVIATGFCVIHKIILLRERGPPPDHTEPQPPAETPTRHSQNRFNICQTGRPSLDTMPEEKQCFISTV